MTRIKGRGKWKYNFYINTFLRGVIASLPIIILLLILFLLFKMLFNLVSPISHLLDPNSEYANWTISLLALIILLVFFFIIGLLVRNRKGKNFFDNMEKAYLCQVPLYTTLRDLVQQLTGLKEMPFSQVVLIDPFDSGVLMTGFITERIGNDMATVFVPTAPNPTNGFIFHVAIEKIQLMDVSADTAVRTVVTMGTGSSCFFSGDTEKPAPGS